MLSSETKRIEAGGWLHRFEHLEKDSDTSTVVWILRDEIFEVACILVIRSFWSARC